MNQPQPKIVTLKELRRVLLRYTHGWEWAEKAILDLWQMGAPIPQDEGQPERRILMPTQFMKWWGEVQERMGYDLRGRDAYARITSNLRTAGGQLRRRR